MKIHLFRFLLLLLVIPFSLSSQILNPSKWKIETKKTGADTYELRFEVAIEPGWHLYSQNIGDEGPIPTNIVFESMDGFTTAKPKAAESGNIKNEFDKMFQMPITYFEGKGVLVHKLKLTKPEVRVKGYIEFMLCDDKQCLPPNEEEFDFLLTANIPTPKVEPAKKVDTSSNLVSPEIDTFPSNIDTPTIEEPIVEPADQTSPEKEILEGDDITGGDQETLWGFLLAAFGFGLIAVVTPCVFPMLPMTVTFFTKKSESRGKAIRGALFYGFSIVAIYALIGITFAAFGLGADFGNWLSTHWLPNILFFLIFIIFAASFLGMFEITLPSSLVNTADSKSSIKSISGIFFMAFTLVLVSFSCTGPIVGSLLIEAAGGAFLKPVMGMAAFGLALALPFTLFAIFPNMLQNLPKSGGWLNSVKVFLGFLELAFAFKFLSIPDQTYHWGILDREIYLAIWIVIFFLLGLYLLGKLKFSHDSDLPYLSFPRLSLAIVVFTFVVYLVPGLWGAPLKALAGYLPPQHTLDFDLYTNTGSVSGTDDYEDLGDVRFKDLFHLPHNLKGFYDLEQAQAYAKKVNKPVFIDFTGHGCVNCREMEANVWSDPEVLKRLKNDYVIVALYVDEKKELPESEWYTSSYDNKVKKSIGKQNSDLQITRYNANAQPYYCLIGDDGNLLVNPKAYDRNVDNFVAFLDNGLKKYKEKYGK